MASSMYGWTRRQALGAGGAWMALGLTGFSAERTEPLIGSITRDVFWNNLQGKSQTWFHPRACLVPQADGNPVVLMTLQTIAGSDYFGPVQWTESRDLGRSWSEPQPIAGFGRVPVPGHEGLQLGVCDVVPEYHPPTNTVLAVGHAVFYRGDRFSRGDQLARYPLYCVRDSAGNWSESRRLEWDDPRGARIYTNNCGQRAVRNDGAVQMSFTFGDSDQDRMVAGVQADFDGRTLTVRDVGPPLHNPHGRGLLEPSVAIWKDRVYLTMRAEDDRGYVAVSDDGLHFNEKRPWSWEDGEPLGLSTTQQHWLTHSDRLYLVYTRKDAANLNVTRWRSPLFLAEVDPERLTLRRESELVALPLMGDGLRAPDHVPLTGNFHVANVSPGESLVTVGSWLPKQKARGAVHIARIAWTRPNREVSGG